MLTLKEINTQLAEFEKLYLSDYVDEFSCFKHEFDPESPEDFDGFYKLTYHTVEFAVPFGVDENGILGIAAAPDMGVYLPLNGEGLYTYLFFEALKRWEKKNEKS